MQRHLRRIRWAECQQVPREHIPTSTSTALPGMAYPDQGTQELTPQVEVHRDIFGQTPKTAYICVENRMRYAEEILSSAEHSTWHAEDRTSYAVACR